MDLMVHDTVEIFGKGTQKWFSPVHVLAWGRLSDRLCKVHRFRDLYDRAIDELSLMNGILTAKEGPGRPRRC
jgi:hypothetical protein